MGTILRSKCTNCGYQAELFVGGGLRDCYAETARSAIPSDEALAKALQDGAMFQIDRDVAVCKHCKQLLVMPYVTYWLTGGEMHHTAAACPQCYGLLTRLPKNTSSTACPVCGQTVSLVPAGHWD